MPIKLILSCVLAFLAFLVAMTQGKERWLIVAYWITVTVYWTYGALK